MALQYYDLVLGGIIASVATGALVGALTSVSSLVAIVAACGVAAGLIGHAIFVGPVEGVEDLSKEVERVGPVELSD
ncbi:hypothetical protein [Halalkalicoccus tibetensis]|uniref:Uncharacterized protein n=1 Tax=Halalkalicoccus tibetensis TaxID=175632 RepID=A0ABD5UXM8_9EURY